MEDFMKIANGWVIYLIYIFVALFVIIESVYYLVKSIKRAKVIGMDMKIIKKVISSSAVFSILPSVGVFIGVVTMAGILGIPFPAIRLTIVGSLQYELMAVDWTATQLGFEGLRGMQEAGGMTAKSLVTFATAMTFGIIWGPLLSTLFFKKMQPKLIKPKEKVNGVEQTNYIFPAVFIGMVTAYLAVSISSIFKEASNIASYYSLFALVVSTLTMWGLNALVEKYNQKWLENFSLAFSMIAGMGIVAVISFMV